MRSRKKLAATQFLSQVQNRAHKQANILLLCVILILIFVLIAPLNSRHHHAPSDWQWITCDVGQGDAHLIRASESSAILLDTGDNPSSLESCLGWAGVQHLDAVVLSHEHSDHYGAYPWCLKTLPIDKTMVSPYFDEHLLKQLEQQSDHPVGDVPAHNSLVENSFLSFPQVQQGWSETSGYVLWPPADSSRVPGQAHSSSWTNNTSLVIRWEIAPPSPGQTVLSVLATGDLEADAAHALIDLHASSLTVQVLKVAHHGSQGSGTDLIIASQPELAVISSGQGNSYGHPHPTIVKFLEQEGISTRRTDQKGHIAVSSHPDGLHITTSS